MPTTEEDVRRIALALPGTTEKPSYGTPGFRVKDKLFARIREERDVHDEEGAILALWCEDLDEKEVLIASDPAKFFTTAHYDGYAMVLVRLAELDVDELTELVTDAWRVRAPQRLVAQLDAGEV